MGMIADNLREDLLARFDAARRGSEPIQALQDSLLNVCEAIRLLERQISQIVSGQAANLPVIDRLFDTGPDNESLEERQERHRAALQMMMDTEQDSATERE